MVNEQDKSLTSWDEFVSGNFLKAINVNSENDAFIVVSLETATIDDRKMLRLNLERNGQNYDFDVNKTNAARLKELGIQSPKELQGKKLFFRKALVRNPTTNKEVEGLRIYRVE